MIRKRDLEMLRELEESLWRPETRFDLEHMDRVLAPDFIEFGRSGRVYSREACLLAQPVQFQCRLPLRSYTLSPISTTVVLATYISEVFYDDWEYANRSSIWVKSPAGWQIRFHQGTPVRVSSLDQTSGP